MSSDHDRAAPKGLGSVKAAGNYAADLSPVHGAHAQGYNTTLYLDAKERKYVEEFSVCNFVGITKDLCKHAFVYVIHSDSVTSEICCQAGRTLRHSEI